MGLYTDLQAINSQSGKPLSEADIKNIYINAIGLKGYQMNLIDIQTKEVWFEAKEGYKTSTYKMFTQLLHYVQQALNKGEYIPPFLCVIDARKAAIMRTEDALPLLKKKTIKWGKSASDVTQEALDEVSTYIGTYIVSFNLQHHEKEFLETIKKAIQEGDIIRIPITPDNLKQVFDNWIELIGSEINEIEKEDYSLLFYADIMHDGTVSTHKNLPAELLQKNNEPIFSLKGKLYELNNKNGYKKFWSIYHRPPSEEYRNYLLERRDSLIPIDERSFKGAYYTPLKVVDKAYDKLSEVLGKNWQNKYVVWDMCCGVGNLETKHSYHRNLFMSTLDQEDIDVMKATKTCVAAERFQYDYLNDDINEDGEIDYNITNKLPIRLQSVIKEKKKILILINPPYAEASSSNNVIKGGGESKTKVSKTKITELVKDYGYAKRELFAQFLVRISIELPHATIGIFSTLKYLNASNFERFRELWKVKYQGGFIVHSKSFDGLKGNFPIGFLIWEMNKSVRDYKQFEEIETDIIDKNATPIGSKIFYNVTKDKFLNKWIPRYKTDAKTIPLKNAITPQNGKAKVTSWINKSIGYFWCNGNDLQQSGQTAILSSVFSSGNGFYILEENLWKVAIMFTARQVIPHSWEIHNDQFYIPKSDLSELFRTDCLIYMLFHGKNLTSSANNLEWNEEKWSIVNHFIPFSEQEVGAYGRFESDFMVNYLQNKKMSNEAKNVLDEARKVWSEYFKITDVSSVRELLKLNRPDVGWYQIRTAIKHRNDSGDFKEFEMVKFNESYKLLAEKLRPKIYEYGLLKK